MTDYSDDLKLERNIFAALNDYPVADSVVARKILACQVLIDHSNGGSFFSISLVKEAAADQGDSQGFEVPWAREIGQGQRHIGLRTRGPAASIKREVNCVSVKRSHRRRGDCLHAGQAPGPLREVLVEAPDCSGIRKAAGRQVYSE